MDILGWVPSTSKEFEDKLKTIFATQLSERAEKVVRINLAGGTPADIEEAINLLPTIDPGDHRSPTNLGN